MFRSLVDIEKWIIVGIKKGVWRGLESLFSPGVSSDHMIEEGLTTHHDTYQIPNERTHISHYLTLRLRARGNREGLEFYSLCKQILHIPIVFPHFSQYMWLQMWHSLTGTLSTPQTLQISTNSSSASVFLFFLFEIIPIIL